MPASRNSTTPRLRHTFARTSVDTFRKEWPPIGRPLPLNGATSYAHAATLTDQVLEPTDGLLERLAEFFEAAAEKVKEADHDDGFDLHYDLQDAAATLRGLGEDLHTAVDRMRALDPRAPAHQTTSAALAGPSPWLPTAVRPAPGRTR